MHFAVLMADFCFCLGFPIGNQSMAVGLWWNPYSFSLCRDAWCSLPGRRPYFNFPHRDYEAFLAIWNYCLKSSKCCKIKQYEQVSLPDLATVSKKTNTLLYLEDQKCPGSCGCRSTNMQTSAHRQNSGSCIHYRLATWYASDSFVFSVCLTDFGVCQALNKNKKIT